MLGTLLLNIVYNTPQCWVYFIVSALNAYTSRSYCLCIVLFRKILAEGGAVLTLSSLLPTTLSLTRSLHLSISLRAPVPDVAHSVYAFAYATQSDTVAIDEPRIEMGGAGTVVLVTIVTE